MDSRVTAYAHLLVERGLQVQAGWQVLLRTNCPARPLVEEVMRVIARRGAYALLRISYGPPHMNLIAVDSAWAVEAPDVLLSEMPPIERHALEQADAIMLIEAPDGREAEAVGGLIARRHLLRQSVRPLIERLGSGTLRTTYGMFPTPTLAEDAGMTLDAYEDFLYASCLLDWDQETRRMQHIADLMDEAASIRILAVGTDLQLSLTGRHGQVEDGRATLPGGRVFWRPVEGSARGVISITEFPAIYRKHEMEGVRLEFRDGHVVNASASRGEDTLLELLAAGEVPWSLHELGVGCNPNIERYTKHALFDGKMNDSVHLVLTGNSPHHAPWFVAKRLGIHARIVCDGREGYVHGGWSPA